jgi:putative phage-type endonuclease
MEQGTPEWFAARLGKATASRVADICAKTKSGPSASRGNYLLELVTERLSGEPTPFFATAAMQWGTEQEPFAREAYEVTREVFVEEVGFIVHPLMKMAGASPDGLVGETGLVEIKCPSSFNMVTTLRANEVPAKYLPQIYFQMACKGGAWCDFVSYDPRLPANCQLFVKRVERDHVKIAEIEDAVEAFLAEVAATEAELRGRK